MFKRFWWVLLVMGFIGPVFGLLVAAVVTYMMPKQYESVVKIEVKPPAAMTEGGRDRMTPQFFGTEFEKIASRDALVRVIDSLDLTARWGLDREAALLRLQAVIDTRNIRGTDLISIRARHPNPEDARDVAAEVANAYQQHHNEIAEQEGEHRKEELRRAVREQEDQVEERRKVLANVVRAKGIIYREDPLSDQPGDDPQEQAARSERDAGDYVDAKRELEADQALLQDLKLKLIGESIEASIPGDNAIIHDHAVISSIPVSPNVKLNLLLGAGLGLLLLPLLALPVMALLNRLIPQGRRVTGT